MGAAKRRGTFEQRKAQRLGKQFGLTNAEIAEAYLMNRKFNLQLLYQTDSFKEFSMINNIIKYYI